MVGCKTTSIAYSETLGRYWGCEKVYTRERKWQQKERGERGALGDAASPDQFKMSEQFWHLIGAWICGTNQRPELLQLRGTGLCSQGIFL